MEVKRWGAQLLDSMFKSGALTKDSKPISTWQNKPFFKQYLLPTFRIHLYKMKQKFGEAIIPHVPTSSTLYITTEYLCISKKYLSIAFYRSLQY